VINIKSQNPNKHQISNRIGRRAILPGRKPGEISKWALYGEKMGN
jgi:hypothetical protein